MQVPVEAADPHGRCGGGGQLDGDRLFLPGDGEGPRLQVRERGPQSAAQAHQPLPDGGGDLLAGGGGAQDGQHPHAAVRAGDRDPERAEGERQPRHQLREAAHGLLRVGEQHGPPGAVGLGDGERPVHVHPPPGAEQWPRQSGEHGEAQQAGGPGAEVDAARVPLGGLDGAHDSLREYEGQLVRYSAAVVSPGRGPAAGEGGGPGRIVPGHTVRILQAGWAGTSADRPVPPPAGPPPLFRRARLSAAWRRRWRWSS